MTPTPIDLYESGFYFASITRQSLMNLRPLALITGASRGIGAEYARALGKKGYDLLLVARDEIRLTTLKKELETSSSVHVELVLLDLAHPNAAQDLYDITKNNKQEVSLLINNAGFGWYGNFSDMPNETIQAMLQVHIDVTTHCTRLFLPDMLKARKGAIINVASIAGFLPIPYMATYAATKAYIIAFSEAIAREVSTKGIHVQVCCPGYTQTDFHETAGHRPKHVLAAQTSQEVVQHSLKVLPTSKVRVTIGWPGRMARWITHWFPRGWLISLTAKFVRKELE